MRIVRSAICLVAVMAAGDALAAYAVAFNARTGKGAAYNGSFDLAAARKEALSRCGGGCTIVISGKGSCGAVVQAISTGGSAWGVGKGTTTDGAARTAWFECRRKGGVNCETAAAICD